MVRCFIGILLPEHLVERVEAIKKELKELPMRCKFVERENLHICLSFLGEIGEKKIKEISEKIDQVCSSFSNFKIIIDGIRAIPSESYIRVLALDIIDKSNNLERLSKDVQKVIGGDAKPSHLTLCRVKNVDNKAIVVQRIKNMKINEIDVVISSVQLIKSELKRTGPIYTSIHEARLTK